MFKIKTEFINYLKLDFSTKVFPDSRIVFFTDGTLDIWKNKKYFDYKKFIKDEKLEKTDDCILSIKAPENKITDKIKIDRKIKKIEQKINERIKRNEF
jgi:hypothetical protein